MGHCAVCTYLLCTLTYPCPFALCILATINRSWLCTLDWSPSGCRGGHHPDTDNAGGEEEVNILAELRPFLPHEPPLVDDMTSRAADAPDMVREAKEATRSGVQDAVAEEQAVRAYVASNGRAGSVHAAGLGLLKALPQEHRQHWTRDTAERALALASALGSTWRPEGTSSHNVFDMHNLETCSHQDVFAVAACHLLHAAFQSG